MRRTIGATPATTSRRHNCNFTNCHATIYRRHCVAGIELAPGVVYIKRIAGTLREFLMVDHSNLETPVRVFYRCEGWLFEVWHIESWHLEGKPTYFWSAP